MSLTRLPGPVELRIRAMERKAMRRMTIDRLQRAMAAHAADIGFGHSTDSCGTGCARAVLTHVLTDKDDNA